MKRINPIFLRILIFGSLFATLILPVEKAISQAMFSEGQKAADSIQARAEAPHQLKTWSCAFSPIESEIPPAGQWQSCIIPGNLAQAAREAEGYIWLHKKIRLENGPKALIVGPLGLSERVYLNNQLIGSTGSSGAGFIAPVNLYRGYVIPEAHSGQAGYQDLYLRVLHRYHSWIEAGIWLVPLESLGRRLFLLNLSNTGIRLFIGVLLLMLFIQALYSFYLINSRYFIYLGFAALSAGLSGLISSFFSLILPFTIVLKLFPVFELLLGIMLVLFSIEYLQFKLIKILFPLIGSLALIGLAGLIFTRFESLLYLRYFQVVLLCIILAAGIVLAALRLPAKPGKVSPLFILYLVIFATFIFQFVKPGEAPRLLRPSLAFQISVAVFTGWIIYVDLFKRNKLYASTTEELVDRVEADWDLIEKLKEGKERLKIRNLESMKLAGRLMESAQKQALTIGDIMSSIAEGTSAENQVMVKEKEILNLTVEVDSRIIDFNQQIRNALQELEQLQEKSKTIAKAVGQIIGIADKTNMLSLNASIEASKAGEAGRGFGVVAKQIRKLADLSRTVSNQINALIRETNKTVEKGVQMVQSLESGFEDIMTESENIRQMVEHNSSALEEVTRAHVEIQDGVAGVDLTIKSLLEVSRDLRIMTGSVARTFAWFDDTLQVERESTGTAGPSKGADAIGGEEATKDADAIAGAEAELEELPALEESQDMHSGGGELPTANNVAHKEPGGH